MFSVNPSAMVYIKRDRSLSGYGLLFAQVRLSLLLHNTFILSMKQACVPVHNFVESVENDLAYVSLCIEVYIYTAVFRSENTVFREYAYLRGYIFCYFYGVQGCFHL